MDSSNMFKLINTICHIQGQKKKKKQMMIPNKAEQDFHKIQQLFLASTLKKIES